MDRILDFKRHAKINFIHDCVFPVQGQGNVYVFKMLVHGPGSGVDLVRRMQPGGDLQNYIVMFDRVKRVRPWTTFACHVYDSTYSKVMTIAVCDMQLEGTDGMVIFWRCLNTVMDNNGVQNPNFKGFMCNDAQGNFDAIRIVYRSGNPEVAMVDRERTWTFYWAKSMYKHTEELIAKDFEHKDITLCKQYKDTTTMSEADYMYHEIRASWSSFGASMHLDAIRELEDCLAFWHFRYRQWGGFMETNLTSEELADIPSCNLAETVFENWIRASRERGSDLSIATADDLVRAFTQVTDYIAYLDGVSSGRC